MDVNETDLAQHCGQCGKKLDMQDRMMQQYRGDLCAKCDAELGAKVWDAIMNDKSNRLVRIVAGSQPDDRRVTSARY